MKKRFAKVKIYGIFRRKDDGGLEGYVENSFSMSWTSAHVRIWRGYTEVKHVFDNDFSNKKDSDKVFIARIHSSMCPINIVNWHPRKTNRKFEWRNAEFKVKPAIVPTFTVT